MFCDLSYMRDYIMASPGQNLRSSLQNRGQNSAVDGVDALCFQLYMDTINNCLLSRTTACPRLATFNSILGPTSTSTTSPAPRSSSLMDSTWPPSTSWSWSKLALMVLAALTDRPWT